MGRDQEKFDKIIDYDGNDNPIYVGAASRGAETSNTVWRIFKINYDGNDNPTSIGWPNKSKDFSFEWDERTTYTYSRTE